MSAKKTKKERQQTRGGVQVIVDKIPGAKGLPLPRENVYWCQKCDGKTVTVDVARGVTPFMIDCRATPGCGYPARSCMYPKTPRPPHIPDPAWEWYQPLAAAELEKLSEQTLEHVKNGGLLLRPRTNAEPIYHD